jgi:magnesium transporter
VKALDSFNTAVVSPVYYVMFTILTIVANMIMYKVI